MEQKNENHMMEFSEKNFKESQKNGVHNETKNSKSTLDKKLFLEFIN